MNDLSRFVEYVRQDIETLQEDKSGREAIRDFFGKIIAYIDYRPNGDQELRNYQQVALGRYIKSSDTTTDYFGKILSRGNTLVSLIKK